jgi:hypothetical protein
MIRITIIIGIIIEITGYIYRYTIMIRPNMTNSITKLLRLEEVLNRRKEINDNHLRIYRYDNAICYKYNTYSEKGDYKYKNKYLNKNNETYLMSYKFEIDDINKYKYLILMRRDNDKMNIIIKYDNKDISDKIILKMILGHFYK